MKEYSMDWSHKARKRKVFDGSKIVGKPVLEAKYYVENIPYIVAKPILKAGGELHRCKTNEVSAFREERGEEKTDEGDVKLIWELSRNNPEAFRRWEGPTVLGKLVGDLQVMQSTRKQVGNREFASESEILLTAKAYMKEREKVILKNINKELKTKIIWTEWLVNVNGIGASIGGILVDAIEKRGGIVNFLKPSGMRHLFGVYPINGKAATPTKGIVSSWDDKLKAKMLGDQGLADMFIMGKHFLYKPIYEKAKARELKEKKVKTKMHAHKRAKRKMVQLFLNHFWVIWRQLEGFSTVPEYVHTVLGHTSYVEPPCIPECLLIDGKFNPVVEERKLPKEQRKRLGK